jgi:hypothetical protein
LPPSIILEVLQILEAEITLREDTRVAEQARPAIKAEEHETSAGKLADDQQELADRTRDVVERILELPDAQANFGKELNLLNNVAGVMDEARGILESHETGKPAIAAETEAIELLLASKRINPKGGGGGGGSSLGGGGGGDDADSALALLGKSNETKEVREDTGNTQTTGTAGAKLPPEWREGIDEYFNRLEGQRRG